MSPVHPRRSSRCGQSVGTARKLPRWDQIELLISWFTPSWEDSNQPVRGDVRMHHDGFDVLGGELPGPPGDLRVAEPVEGEGRLEELSGGVPGQGDRVGGLRGAQRAGAQLLVL